MKPLSVPEETTDSYLIQGELPTAGVPGLPLFGVYCYWIDGVAIATSGPYASASIPSVTAGLDKGEVTRQLILAQPTSDYSLQTQTPPALTEVQGWQWSGLLTHGTGSLSSSAIPLTAANVAGLQWQSKKVFIGGVLLGIATGALVTLMTSVLGTADKSRKRRLKRRLAEAHGGKEANADVEK